MRIGTVVTARNARSSRRHAPQRQRRTYFHSTTGIPGLTGKNAQHNAHGHAHDFWAVALRLRRLFRDTFPDAYCCDDEPRPLLSRCESEYERRR